MVAMRWARRVLSIVACGAASFAWIRPASGLRVPDVSTSRVEAAGAAGRAVARLLATGQHPDLRRRDFHEERLALERVYGAPVEVFWWTPAGPKPSAGNAISVLRAAETEGLAAEDYDVGYLDRAAGRLAAGPAASPAEVAAFDVALSLSMIRFLGDVHRGRVDPRHLGFDYHAGREHDIGDVLRRAVATGRLSDALHEVQPTVAQYRRLRAALARYRALAREPTLVPIRAVKVLRPGEPYPDLPRLGGLLHALGDLPDTPDACENDRYGAPLVEAVRRFQARHGLGVDGVVGPSTFRALNVPLRRRVRQIELALERLRWLPHAPLGKFLVVNVPAFRLVALEAATAERPALQMAVVVGRAARTRTPLFADAVESVLFRPPWYPPRSIVWNEILPAVRRNPAYLAEQMLELVARGDDRAAPLPATAANLARLAAGSLLLRQRPGPQNALGLLKFELPNRYDVYLHDTPSRTLFARARRDFSHGCIRVEDPAGLAEFLLAPGPWTRARIGEAMNGDRTFRVDLPAAVPVFIYYTTAIVRHDGTVEFFEDIYGLDDVLARSLRRDGRPVLAGRLLRRVPGRKRSMSTMNRSRRAHREAALRDLLANRREEIVEKLHGLRELAPPEAAAAKDPDDHAADDLSREMEFALAEMRSATLQRIEDALRRLGEGTYGVCTDCGADIPQARLKALPFASLCRNCQFDRERFEREESARESAAESPLLRSDRAPRRAA
jgi:RNA polymerase-binding protein DksA